MGNGLAKVRASLDDIPAKPSSPTEGSSPHKLHPENRRLQALAAEHSEGGSIVSTSGVAAELYTPRMTPSNSSQAIFQATERLKKVVSRDDLLADFHAREVAAASLKRDQAMDWLPEYHPPSVSSRPVTDDTVVERVTRISTALLLQDIPVARKTKVVCTLGPACWSEAGLEALLVAGMNVARFNFSHGTHAAHQEVLDRLRKVAGRKKHIVGYLLDTKGPEVRTAMLKDGKDIELVAGQEITVVGVGDDYVRYEGYKNAATGETRIGISYAKLCASSKPGNIILIADGVISIEVVRILNDQELLGRVINSHKLGQRKNCNLPGVKVDLPVLSPNDIKDVQNFAVKNDMDYVAASFVQSAEDVKFIRKVLNDAGGRNIGIISKIENEAGLRDIDGIIRESDGIMVARGDLAMEVPAEKIALAQKMIIAKCNNAGKFVITATQMLESMIESIMPTRAEMTDVANAVFDGTDAVMLSGETANGSYPEVAVRTMARIVETAELGVDYSAAFDTIRHANSGKAPISAVEATLAGAAKSAVLFYNDNNGDGVLDASEGCMAVVFTKTGRAAHIMSKYRPPCPVITVSNNDAVLRGCTARYGLYPLKLEVVVNDVVMATAKALQYAQQQDLEFDGKSVIVVAGREGEELWADEAPEFTVDLLGTRSRITLEAEAAAKMAAYISPFAGNCMTCVQTLRIAPELIINKQFNYRSTKIVATLGPSSWSSEQMARLVQCGISVGRLVLTYYKPEESQQHLDRFIAVCDAHERRVSGGGSGNAPGGSSGGLSSLGSKELRAYTPRPAVMCTLQGPEIRTCRLRGHKPIMLKAGQEVALVVADSAWEGHSDEGSGIAFIGITYPQLCTIVGPGDTILLAEGTITIEVTRIMSDTELRGRCLNTRALDELRIVDIPNKQPQMPLLTEKDLGDLKWIASNKAKVDFVCVPYTRSAQDVKTVRDVLDHANAVSVKVIAAIESPEALAEFDAILEAADGIVISRANLGMRMTAEKIALAQKWMITKANLVGKPIMVAAHLLESMVNNPRPTRAEMTDVANAAYDGADAIVLRSETASGLFADKSVTIAAAILRDAEVGIDCYQHYNFIRNFTPKPMSTLEAVCSSAVKAAIDMDALLIVICTDTSYPIRSVCKYRPHCAVVVVTTMPHVARQANIEYGAIPLLLDQTTETMEQVKQKVMAFAQQLRLAELNTAGSHGGNSGMLRPGQLLLLRGPCGRMYATEEDLAQMEFCAMAVGDIPKTARRHVSLLRGEDTVAVRSTKVGLDLICSPIDTPRKTKIVCTLGPKCWSEEGIGKLLDGGMNIARFNFSHGAHADHQAVLDRVRKVAAARMSTVAFMLDTKGPEVRTAMLRGHQAIELEAGQRITVVAVGDAYTSYEGYKNLDTGETKIGLSYAPLCQDVKPGGRILIGDGTITIEVVRIMSPTELEGKVLNSKKLGERKNCNLPGVKVRLPVLTESDINDVQNFAVKNNMDFVAASFVQTGDDVRFIRKQLDAVGGHFVKIISKIESASGLQEYDEILEETDGIMVARGDLAMEIPSEKVALAQKMMITKANIFGKFVITATQMLESMIDSPMPTRAEMTDVANAVFDGTDAVMLSGETANGDFPDRAVATMAAIAANAEVGTNYYQTYDFVRDFTPRPMSVVEAIVSSAAKDALDVAAELILVVTSTGNVARIVSKYHPKVPILVVTASPQVARHLNSSFALLPYLVPELPPSRREVAMELLLEHATIYALGLGLLSPGKEIVVVHGTERADAEGSPMYSIRVAPGQSDTYECSKVRKGRDTTKTLSLRTTAISLTDILDYGAPPRKTKVVCTLGPACWSEAGLEALLVAGMNVARFNFSHGTHAAHQEVLDRLRKVEGRVPRVAYMLDTKGPEVRTAMVRNGANIDLVSGQEVTLVAVGEDYINWEGFKDEKTGLTKIGISYAKLATSVKPGGRILIADGTLTIEVIRIASATEVVGRCLNSKSLGARKNCNLPGVKVDIPVLTTEDINDLQQFCCKNKMDYVAASFVQSAADVHFIRRILDQAGGKTVKIISKIENEAGLECYDAILRASDGIMVARGDLAMEIPSEKVALAQKMMITKANIAGKFVITATQMLESMISNPLPTRAEMTDVANAVFDGTDAVMLSGETANGKFSDVAVATMAAIAQNAENANGYVANQLFIRDHSGKPLSRAEALGVSVSVAMVDCNAQLIIVFSSDGFAAKFVSKYHPAVPVIVVTDKESTARGASVVFGQYSLKVDSLDNVEELISLAKQFALQKALWNGEGCGIVLNGKFEVSADVQAVMRAVNLAEGHTGGLALLSQTSSLARAFSMKG